MAIALRGTVSTAVLGASGNVAKPTGVVSGDLLIITMAGYSGPTLNTPSGFTVLPSAGGVGGGVTAKAFYRIADGSEGANFAISSSGGDSYLDVDCAAYSGIDTASPFNLTAAPNGGTATTITALDLGSTTRDGCWHILSFHCWNSGASGNPPSGYTADASYDGPSQFLDHKLITTAGATGAQSITAGGGGGWVAHTYAIQPPDTATPYVAPKIVVPQIAVQRASRW